MKFLHLAAVAMAVSSLFSVLRADQTISAPRVFLFDSRQLLLAGQMLQSGDTNLRSALAQLQRDSKQALKSGPFTVTSKAFAPPSGDKHDYMSMAPYYWPDPKSSNGLPYIRRDGERNPEIGKIQDHRNMSQMAGDVETMALAYYFTGDEECANKAANLLRAWFLNPETRMNPKFEYAQAVAGINTGRGTGLIESICLTHVVDSIGLLAGSKSWTEADQRGMHEWFSKFLAWMIESRNGKDEAAARNNHGTYYDLQVASYALFVDKPEIATNILRQVPANRIKVQVEPDGRQPLELVRTKAWGYSVANLRGLIDLADISRNVGVDLWHYQTPDGAGIRKAIEFLTPYSLGDKEWSWQQISGFTGESLYQPLRRAALEYQDPKFDSALKRIPPIRADSRAVLMRPQLAVHNTSHN